MKLYRTAVTCGWEQLGCDTLEIDGVLWLVPQWTEPTSGSWSKPERIIRMSGLRYQRAADKSLYDFVLSDPIPADVFTGRRAPDDAAPHYVVKVRPDLRRGDVVKGTR